MNLAEKVTRAKADLDAVYEAGKAAGGGNWLATYQENGTRTNYNTGFAGIGWTQELHDQLPYPITVELGWYCFGYSKVKYLTNVSFVQRKGLATMACCYGCDELLEVGDFDLYYNSDVRNFFYNCRKLRKIGRFVFPSAEYLNSGNHTNIFYNCNALEDITVDGVVGGYDISFQQSTKLSKASIESIVAALSDTATGYKLTLSTTAVNKAFETAEGANDGVDSYEWYALKETKPNWEYELK